MKALILAAALALAALPAAAQPALPDPEGVLLQELVVQAREPGPAWWRVSDADTTIYILGIGEDAIPADIAWDRSWLQRRLKGANALIVGTRISLTGGLGDIPALLRARAALRTKTPLEETLPPPLRARFVAVRERIGTPASKYAHWGPLIAGEQLVSDSRRAGGPTASVVGAVMREAKRQKVKVTDPIRYDALPFVRQAMGSLTPQVQHQCLEGALRDAEAPAARYRAAAEGWARGDVAAAVAEPRSFDRCALLLGGGAELWRRARDDRTAAIVTALQTPGHAVAVMSLRQLLADDGILETLQRKGLTVKGPGEP